LRVDQPARIEGLRRLSNKFRSEVGQLLSRKTLLIVDPLLKLSFSLGLTSGLCRCQRPHRLDDPCFVLGLLRDNFTISHDWTLQAAQPLVVRFAHTLKAKGAAIVEVASNVETNHFVVAENHIQRDGPYLRLLNGDATSDGIRRQPATLSTMRCDAHRTDRPGTRLINS
jgi:hypothetical protein